MRPDAIERVKQRFLETAVDGHALVRGQIAEQRGETFLQADGHVHAFDLDRRSRVEQVLSEPEQVAVQIPDAIVA
jgi:hypothetical protein